MEKITKYHLWTILNIFWWFISIYLAPKYDTNPLLGNNGEIVLNLLIFGAGLLFIDYHVTEEDLNNFQADKEGIEAADERKELS